MAATWLACQVWADLDVQTSATVAALVCPVIGAALAAWAGHSGEQKAVADSDPPNGRREVVYNLPPRNPCFVGRDIQLAAFENGLEERTSTVVQVLHGIGGVGKTTLSTEYAYRRLERYDLVWWIDAETPSMIGGQLTSLGVAAGWVKTAADIPSALREVRLQFSRTDRWLLIFDNAEDPAALAQWVPQGPGHVIITSRNPAWELVGDPVAVDPFSRAESVALMRRLSPTLSSAEANDIAGRLEDLPLAVAQACSLMNETGMSAAEYLKELDRNGRDLLEDGRLPTYPTPLTQVVVTALRRLEEESPVAVQLLEICSMMAAEPIPVELFSPEAAAVLEEPLAAQLQTTLGMRRTLGWISRYGLAQVDGKSILLHRLVQLVISGSIEAERRPEIRRRADEVLANLCPADSKSTSSWELWDRLMPHLLASDLVATRSTAMRSAAHAVAWYLLERGELKRGQELAATLYEHWRVSLGPDDRQTLSAAHTLASALWRQARYAECQDMAVEVYRRSRRAFGEDQLLTLNAADHVASNLRILGKPQEARALHEDTLKRKARIFGEEHLETLGTAHNLALDLRALGRHEESLALNQETYVRRRRVLGDDHPHTLLSAYDVVIDLLAAGRTDEALTLCRETVRKRVEVLGREHPETVKTTRLAEQIVSAAEVDTRSRLSG
ncbi:FxSxx-COOH system tetratricopeptide repeat protein [Micromonospora aurantiaca]|uniref:FxSxx-COOH system tetratricopeptide repeat protein n=1 Tax=Micromonospora aurantiaca (nom. illeg.) TaxID=47850 RepID=UPI003820AC3F